MQAKAYCAHPSICDYWALRCTSSCPDQVDNIANVKADNNSEKQSPIHGLGYLHVSSVRKSGPASLAWSDYTCNKKNDAESRNPSQ
ncbi:hypothetical protein TNCV_3218901 [Trichonephila clavipes]|nr:hypothetical protein TNCV_3218901 [Trichonephila clavipes]